MDKRRTQKEIQEAVEFIRLHKDDMGTDDMARELNYARPRITGLASEYKIKLTYANNVLKYKSLPRKRINTSYTKEEVRLESIDNLVFCRKW